MASFVNWTDFGTLLTQGGKTRGIIGDSLSLYGGGTVLADHYGWTLNNTARGGDAVADQGPKTFRYQPIAGDIYAVWLGTNDKNLGGGITARENDTKAGHLATIMHLATKEANKVRPPAMTKTGTWIALNSFSTDGNGTGTVTNGSTLTASVTGTDICIVGWWDSTTTTGAFSITIDGVSKGSFNAFPASGNLGNQVTIGPFALLFSGLSNAAHTVVLTATSGVGQPVYISYFSGHVSGASINPADPLVAVSNIHDYTAAGNTAQGTTTAQNLRYCTLIAANVTTAQGLGLNVKLVDIVSIITSSDIIADGIHLTQGGYLKVRDAFVAQIG